MKKYARVLVAVTSLLGLSVAANAEIRGVVKVTLPFEFVASGKTLPAGTYTVSRVSPEVNRALVIRSNDNSVFMLPLFFDGNPVSVNGVSADRAELGFEHVGDKYFLTDVETLAGC